MCVCVLLVSTSVTDRHPAGYQRRNNSNSNTQRGAPSLHLGSTPTSGGADAMLLRSLSTGNSPAHYIHLPNSNSNNTLLPTTAVIPGSQYFNHHHQQQQHQRTRQNSLNLSVLEGSGFGQTSAPVVWADALAQAKPRTGGLYVSRDQLTRGVSAATDNDEGLLARTARQLSAGGGDELEGNSPPIYASLTGFSAGS